MSDQVFDPEVFDIEVFDAKQPDASTSASLTTMNEPRLDRTTAPMLRFSRM